MGSIRWVFSINTTGIDRNQGNAAIDLESFAKHAGRSNIKTDDVLLLARRNEGLHEHLKKKAAEQAKVNMEKSKA